MSKRPMSVAISGSNADQEDVYDAGIMNGFL